ncbi:hypothetical protein ACSSS7_003199 [Eimeria intestinalis]
MRSSGSSSNSKMSSSNSNIKSSSSSINNRSSGTSSSCSSTPEKREGFAGSVLKAIGQSMREIRMDDAT